jgi:hypothetical protein
MQQAAGTAGKNATFFFFFCAAFDRWMCEYEMSATESLYDYREVCRTRSHGRHGAGLSEGWPSEGW